MKKTLTWITWLSLSAVSPIALAVSLGQASVSSYLNAPLDASIPLLESSDYALDDIRVSVAEQSAFAAAGLEWTPLAANVRAQVVEHQGQWQVRLRSEQTVQEPWLDLLLTVEFPGGQQFRDITLLFDPQGYSQNQALAQNVVPSPPAASNATTPPVVQSRSTPPSSAYVGNGDTLWGVAERIKPDEVSVQQMMMALLEANPNAFSSGNINDMRAGQTLSVPGAERILARSHDDADAAIKAMNDAWRNRRNGSLQTVALPEVDAVAPVSDTSIAAAQALQANEPSNPDSALAAGGSESVVPEAVDQVAIEEGVNEPEALTRAELTEQLRLSQATLQQVLEERELMRAELNELRGEVASLTQALSDALAAQEQTPAPLVASMDETDSPDVAALIERYQWPLALAAIAMLLALLVWLRKRREETWEDVPLAEPVVSPTVSPSAAPKATPMPEAVPVTYPAHTNEGDVEKPHNDSGQSTAPQNESEVELDTESEPKVESEVPTINNPAPTVDTDQWLVDDQGQAPSQDKPLRFENSQASGLVEQGRQRRLGLHVVSNDSSDNVGLAPPPSSMPMSQLLASLGTGVPATEPAAANAHVQQTDNPSETAEDPGHRFIDYHPPILNSTLSSASNSQSGLRTETPMQPTVEFSRETVVDPVPAAKQSRRPIEDEWEIEEVAFKPRGLDNSDPSKSSK
ncbi:FimV/HubP family polar landmark protein [Halomonas alkaliantarctica]|uniref:FimV/HubP family polar landmark protein n=1 Tax=Halomonas alkaliantarctica TaxID=232346 RepID=A0ABY8LH78_9GAMM|nr:FimV/HubP family polar landmark protein [Halomonas alkaliantarctica]WGI23820.1 FimV/HubP family polar landmark protein [Halomonas alkaliantarctica]